jgi:hypothetical protein
MMMKQTSFQMMMVTLAGVWMGCLGGCEKYVMAFPEIAPAEYAIPSNVERIAIVPFASNSPEQSQWGNLATRKIEEDLNEYSAQFGGFVLVSREQTADLLKARTQESNLASSQKQLTKMFARNPSLMVNAYIYGTAETTHSKRTMTTTKYDPITETRKRVRYTAHNGSATVTYRFVDIRTTEMIASKTIRLEFDSENKANRDAMSPDGGLTEQSYLSKDRILSFLIAKCSSQFVALISSHEEEVRVLLSAGKKEGKLFAEKGNILAATELHKGFSVASIDLKRSPTKLRETSRENCLEAIELYSRSYKANPQHPDVLINKAVCYEWLGANCLRRIAKGQRNEHIASQKDNTDQVMKIIDAREQFQSEAREMFAQAEKLYNKAFMDCSTEQANVARNGRTRVREILARLPK